MHEHREDFDRLPYWEPTPKRRTDFVALAVVGWTAASSLYVVWHVLRWIF
jgi:hypothetical protein